MTNPFDETVNRSLAQLIQFNSDFDLIGPSRRLDQITRDSTRNDQAIEIPSYPGVSSVPWCVLARHLLSH